MLISVALRLVRLTESNYYFTMSADALDSNNRNGNAMPERYSTRRYNQGAAGIPLRSRTAGPQA